MKIDKALIDKISSLAKLEFNDEKKEKMVSDMKKIISFVEKLNEVDTKGVDPLIYINEDINILREDKVGSHSSKTNALKNAPEKDSDYFKVPKVLNK